MIRVPLRVLAPVLLSVFGVLAAQVQAQPALSLTVQEAVARALELSEEVRLAREQQTLAEAQTTQARAAAYPQITGNLQYDRALRTIFDGTIAPDGDDTQDDPFADLPFGQANTWIASLQINQALYTGGRVPVATEIARLTRSTTDLQITEAEADIARQVRDAYFQAVFTASLAEIAAEAYGLASDQAQIVESQYRQGTTSEFELLQARVERDNLQPQIVEAENARTLAMLELKRLINVPSEQPLELAFALEPAAIELTQIDRQRLLAAAMNRPSLRVADQQVRIQEQTVELARAQRRPTVSAFGVFSYQAFPDRLLPTGLPGGSDWREDWGVGLQVSIPIFDGGQARGAINEARSNVRRAQLQQRQLTEGVELEVAAGLAQFDAARAQIEARQATVREALRALELAELRYGTGLATLIEVSNARLLLQQAQVNEAEAFLAYLSSLVALEHASGGQVPLVDPMLLAN